MDLTRASVTGGAFSLTAAFDLASQQIRSTGETLQLEGVEAATDYLQSGHWWRGRLGTKAETSVLQKLWQQMVEIERPW